MTSRRKLKNMFLHILYRLGIFRAMRWVNRKNVTILFVHGVTNVQDSSEWVPLRPPLDADVFRKQIETIDQNYNFVTYDTAVDMIAGRTPIQNNSIAISFDDGYRNNQQVALPILEEHNIKPIMFIATAFSNNQKTFWFDRFDYIIQQVKEDVELSVGDRKFVFLAGDRENLGRTYAAFRAHAKNAKWSDSDFTRFFDTTCEDLEKTCGRSLASIQSHDPVSATLSDGDLTELSRTGRATIGSHTVDHVRLDKEGSDVCTTQITCSKTRLESIIGEECENFSYPNGGVDRRSRDLVEAAGYLSACTVQTGFNRQGDDVFLLKRIHLPDSPDPARLLNLLSGTGYLVSTLKRLARRRQ